MSNEAMQNPQPMSEQEAQQMREWLARSEMAVDSLTQQLAEKAKLLAYSEAREFTLKQEVEYLRHQYNHGEETVKGPKAG